MTFTLVSPKKIRKQIEQLEEYYKPRLNTLFLELKQNPVPVQSYDVEKIAGSENTYRIRISGIRIIFDVLWNQKEVHLLKIEKRKDRTYKKM